ncbi:MEDS domain-containing protein [Streptomyces sp. NPDC087917]|uniref:MEDS domain-containing protein n=1 Tax=unclassified Streptomyces TaxID=2593676 RepID=UPI003438B8E6
MTSPAPHHHRPPHPVGGHSSFAYEDDEEWARAVVRFVTTGLADGQRVLYSADRREPSAVIGALRRGGVDVDSARHAELLTVTSGDGSFLHRPPFEPDRVVSAYRTACAEALAAGHRGLRVLGEMSWSTTDVPDLDRILEYELLLDREVYARLPLTGLCLFDRRRVPAEAADLLARAHTGAGPTDARAAERPRTTPAATPLRGRAGARLTGSGDQDGRYLLRTTLAAVTRMPGTVVHLELADMAFLDVGAVALLVEASVMLNRQDRRLLLHNPPHSLRRVAQMFPDECAALEVAG